MDKQTTGNYRALTGQQVLQPNAICGTVLRSILVKVPVRTATEDAPNMPLRTQEDIRTAATCVGPMRMQTLYEPQIQSTRVDEIRGQ